LGSATPKEVYRGEISQVLISFRAFDKKAVEGFYKELIDEKIPRPLWIIIPEFIQQQDRLVNRDTNDGNTIVLNQ
jgi:hypothetical protein